MALLTASDFRADTLAEYCTGFALGEEFESAAITSAITRLTERLSDWTNDVWESSAETLELSVHSATSTLRLPKRTRGITTVKTRNTNGVETTQAATVYRLRSSLNTSGTAETGTFDALEIVGTGLASVTPSGWAWPQGINTVQVAGTFGWATAPADAKYALAELVWDHFKSKRGDLRRASRVSTQDSTVEYLPPDPDIGIFTGLPNVDAFIRRYRYDPPFGVG